MRSVRVRFGEYHFQAHKKIDDTPWGEHMKLKRKELILDKELIFINGKIIAPAKPDSTRHTEKQWRFVTNGRCASWTLLN